MSAASNQEIHPCAWCGIPISRPASWFRGNGPFFCGPAHQGQANSVLAITRQIEQLTQRLEKLNAQRGAPPSD